MQTASSHQRGFLSILLTIFIGLLVAGFIGLGIEAFYPAPKSPEYPVMPMPVAVDDATNAKQQEMYAANRKTFDDSYKQYQKDLDAHNRNVAIIAIVAALLLLVGSLILVKGPALIGDGLLLGGIFSLIYSITRAGMSNNSKLEFGVVAASLAVTIFLAYRKFGHLSPDA